MVGSYDNCPSLSFSCPSPSYLPPLGQRSLPSLVLPPLLSSSNSPPKNLHNLHRLLHQRPHHYLINPNHQHQHPIHMAKSKKAGEKSTVQPGATLEIDVDSFVRTRDSVSPHFLLLSFIFLDHEAAYLFILTSSSGEGPPPPPLHPSPLPFNNHCFEGFDHIEFLFSILMRPFRRASRHRDLKVDESSTTTRHCLHRARPALLQ